MKVFTIKILLFAAVFFIFDKLFIILADLSSRAEVDKRLEQVITGKMSKEIIIAGSSTGSRDIIAKQMENETGFTVYNLCYPGSDVEFHEFILRTFLKFNDPPKIILLVVDDYAELLYDKTIMFRKDRLYPLVKYPYISRELAKQEGRDYFFSNFLVLDRMNKSNLDLRKKRFTPLDTIFECGSMPISWKPERSDFDYSPGERIYPIEKELPGKVLAFREIINICKSNNIKLVLVIPPVYKNPSVSFQNRIRQLGGENVCFYLYNRENLTYRVKDSYFDNTHLMRNAAVEFTSELSKLLDLIQDLQ